MNKKAYKLSIAITDIEQQEIVVAMLAQHDITAVEQQDNRVIVYDESEPLLREALETVVALPFLSDDQIKIEEITTKNWNEEWERSFQPIHVGDFCGVRASFHQPMDTSHEIIINPELAFGTGHHETTYMMIDQMRRLDWRGQRVFDFGCGTAILAILARKLGSSYTLAIDYDDQAIKCAADCLQLNDTKGVELRTGTIDQVPEGHFDIILANINRNVLIDAVQDIYTRQAEGGILLLSGLLQRDEQHITELYQEVGYAKKNVCYRGEWISMLMIK